MRNQRHPSNPTVAPLLGFLLAVLAGLAPGVPAQDGPADTAAADGSVVHAVLFYSPTCGHCEKVIREDLLPLQERHGDRFVLVALNTRTEYGSALFQAAMAQGGIPRDEWGVPYMMVGDRTFGGSLEIPEEVPPLVEAGLAGEGIGLPDFPALLSFLEAQGALEVRESEPRYVLRDPAAEDAAPAEAGGSAEAREAPAPAPADPSDAGPGDEEVPAGAPGAASPGVDLRGSEGIPIELDEPASASPWDRFARDPAGNGLAVVVLLGMLAALARSLDLTPRRRTAWPGWVTPVLAVAGLGVALYLSFVEVTGTPATCGPVGDCNTVQQSSWATLFGVLPVGVLGVGAYLAVLALWVVRTLGPEAHRRPAALGLWALAVVGTVFSIYLTFLEPFVIGATCLWCLTSAVLMTLILLASVGPAAGRPADRREPAPGPRPPARV